MWVLKLTHKGDRAPNLLNVLNLGIKCFAEHDETLQALLRLCDHYTRLEHTVKAGCPLVSWCTSYTLPKETYRATHLQDENCDNGFVL